MLVTQISCVKPALSGALSVILPTAEQTDLLRACLHTGASGRQAWERWQERMGGLKKGLEEGSQGIKGLLPLLSIALRRDGVVDDPTLLTYVRTAYLREELRSQIYRRLFRNVLAALATDRIPVLVLKGAALADTVYEKPALRHCHDIDLLVGEDDMCHAVSRLTSLGWTLPKTGRGSGIEDLRLEHESGLPLELHRRLFRLPYYRAPLADIWARSQMQSIAGISTRILSPADSLLYVCGHASYCRSRESLRWVCDSWFLINRCPDLDWDVLVDCTLRSHLALPLSVMLAYLAEVLRAPIPASVLDRLYAAASQTDTVEREIALLGARVGARGNFQNIVRMARGWRARMQVVQWILFPAPSYLHWAYHLRSSWWLPVYYMYRPLRYIARRMGGVARAAHGASDVGALSRLHE